MQEMCQEMHVIRWMFTVSVIKCPLVLFVNFTITSENKYGQIKVIECPPNYANQWGKHSSKKANPNVESKGGYGWLVEKYFRNKEPIVNLQ